MTKEPSKTANRQRLEEMLIHLTPLGVTSPHSVCVDSDRNLWVAAKGALFKMDRFGNILLRIKNQFLKKASPFYQVLHNQGKIISAFAENHSGLTEIKVMDLSGELISEQLISGKIESLTISDAGELFLTKRSLGSDSVIYKGNVYPPAGLQEVISEEDFTFQTLCSVTPNFLVAATCNTPVSRSSKQRLRLIDTEKGKVIRTFSEKGKRNGQIFFPLAIQRYGEDILVLDKTGRIQQFTRDGTFVRIAANINEYFTKAFITDDDTVLLACSGTVLDRVNKTICDDWLEKVSLYGTKLPIPNYFFQKVKESTTPSRMSHVQNVV